MIEEINDLNHSMRELTIAAGVRPFAYDDLFEDLHCRDLDMLLRWLRLVREGPYQDLLDVWRLVPEATWKNYKHLGLKDMPEQLLLKECQRVLRGVWHDEARQQKIRQGHLDAVLVRPEVAGTDVSRRRDG